MSATQHTNNLHLSQFQSTDVPTWMTDYNGDMHRIDNAVGNPAALKNPDGDVVSNLNDTQGDLDILEAIVGSKTDLPTPTKSVTENISQINNNLSSGLASKLNKGNLKFTGNMGNRSSYQLEIDSTAYEFAMLIYVGTANGGLSALYSVTGDTSHAYGKKIYDGGSSTLNPTFSISNKVLTISASGLAWAHMIVLSDIPLK